MAEHTKGPWKVAGRNGIYQFDIIGPKGEDIGYANRSDGADDPEMYHAAENARLMAAAPDLLAALKSLVSHLRSVERWPVKADHMAYLESAEGAIRKAEVLAPAAVREEP